MHLYIFFFIVFITGASYIFNFISLFFLIIAFVFCLLATLNLLTSNKINITRPFFLFSFFPVIIFTIFMINIINLVPQYTGKEIAFTSMNFTKDGNLEFKDSLLIMGDKEVEFSLITEKRIKYDSIVIEYTSEEKGQVVFNASYNSLGNLIDRKAKSIKFIIPKTQKDDIYTDLNKYRKYIEN